MKKFVFALCVGVVGCMLETTAVRAQVPDHLLCYTMQDPLKLPTGIKADLLGVLQPEFSQQGCILLKPKQFCVPVIKANVSPAPPNPNIIGQPLEGDYICYSAKCPRVGPPTKVVTDQFGQRREQRYLPATVCVPAIKTPLGCPVGATTGAMCGGACPDPTQVCHFDRKNKVCTCTTQAVCGGKPDSTGTCGGGCPTGEACLPATSATNPSVRICKCQPPPPPLCGMTAAGICGGTCPNPADKCGVDAAGQCSCQPVTPPCAKGANGCGGSCPFAGQQCATDSSGNCGCAPPNPCGQNPLTGTCGGECPTAGDQCVLNAVGQCTCQPPQCGSNASGACNGSCPLPTQNCVPDASGACNCQPPPACGQTGPNTCGGTCPPGTTCKPGTGPAFTCACS